MATYVPPQKNVGYIFYVGLFSQADTKLLQANPTIAAGDFKVSTDGGAFANLATLPDVDPDAGTAVKITLSTSEMNGDNIVVTCIDAAGAEWCDLLINIQTSAQSLNTVDTNIDTMLTRWTAALATALASYTAARAGYLDQLDFNLQEAIAAISAATIADAILDEDVTGHETADTVGRVLGALMGHWEITDNQLICKGLSGNILFTFDLTRDGDATEFNPDKRDPV